MTLICQISASIKNWWAF